MKKFLLKNSFKLKSGFTLVETLVAASIFILSVLGMLVLISGSISNANYAKRKIIASYLAQEGIEYVRNIRDTYVLFGSTSQNGWDSFKIKLLNASCGATNGCYFDDQNLNYSSTSQPMTQITMNSCGSSCPTLLYSSSNGKYGYAAGTISGYIRKIKMIQESSDQIKILSTVFWTQASGTYSITLSETLYNWVE